MISTPEKRRELVSNWQLRLKARRMWLFFSVAYVIWLPAAYADWSSWRTIYTSTDGAVVEARSRPGDTLSFFELKAEGFREEVNVCVRISFKTKASRVDHSDEIALLRPGIVSGGLGKVEPGPEIVGFDVRWVQIGKGNRVTLQPPPDNAVTSGAFDLPDTVTILRHGDAGAIARLKPEDLRRDLRVMQIACQRLDHLVDSGLAHSKYKIPNGYATSVKAFMHASTDLVQAAATYSASDRPSDFASSATYANLQGKAEVTWMRWIDSTVEFYRENNLKPHFVEAWDLLKKGEKLPDRVASQAVAELRQPIPDSPIRGIVGATD